jgi:hypothetical protein
MNRKHEAGQVIPLVAVCLTVLMGFGGMAVDNGYWQYSQRQQQSAADGAAVDGAQALAAGGCGSSGVATTAAQNGAAGNGYTNGGTTTVTVSNPPSTGPYSGNDCAVSVQISAQHSTFFSRLFGRGTSFTETTAATAQLVQNGSECIYLMNSSAVSTFNGGNITAPGCKIAVNGSFSSGSQIIDVGGIGYAGSPPSTGGTKFTGASPAPIFSVTNPCPKIAGCASLTNNPPPITNCQTLKANMNPTISPGCYNQLSVGTCGTVTFEPGTYVLNGTSDFSNSSFVGTGVTFYVTASGTPPDFSASNSATISPPTSGATSGVLYYQVPSNTAAPNLSGSSVRFSGLVYAPSATNVNFNGAQGDYSVLVFGSANLSSSSGYNFGTPPPDQSLVSNVVLVQ